MKKKVIVIASVLKPVTDPRMYEKIGLTLAKDENHEVHIMGFCSRKHVRRSNINFHDILCANRLSWKRFTVSFKYYKSLIKVKPNVVIASSPDILIVTIVYKILFRCSFFYDIRENYYLNLVHTDAFPVFIRNILAVLVRSVEWATRPFVDRYLLAERCYAQELPFVKNKYEIVENKYEPTTDVLVVPRRRSRFRLLYTGTIAETYGIFEAVELVRRLYQVDTRYTLTVVGYASREEERERLREAVSDCSYINLIGIDHPVPHEQIIRSIKEADFAIAPYQANRSTRDKIPTKFYEYIYHRIPFLIPSNSLWEAFCLPYHSVLSINFSLYNPRALSASIQAFNCFDYPIDYKALLYNHPNVLAT